MIALQKGVRSNLTLVNGAEVVDDYTVVLTLDDPFPGLLPALTRLYILNSELVKANEEDGDWGEKWLQNNDAGSGPYQLESFQAEQQFTIEKFDDYHMGWEGDHVDRAIFRVIKEEATRQIALENGEVDWATIGNPETFETLAAKDGIEVTSDETLNQLYFALNTQNPNLQDARVRQALGLVYDYQGHVEQARQGHSAVARGPLPSVIPCFNDSIPASETNIEKAKALMAEAGVPEGGFDLEMAYQGTSPEETVAMQIMQAGAAELGITIKPVAVEWPAKVGMFASQDTAPGIGTIWIFPPYADPDPYLYAIGHSSLSSDKGGFNFSYYSDPRMDELLDAGKVELDPDKRCEIYTEVQQIWLDEVPYINVVLQYDLVAHQDYVKGYRWNSAHSRTQNVYDISLDGKS
jgi:peptide/nickel transport system substrate-binding protein